MDRRLGTGPMKLTEAQRVSSNWKQTKGIST
jgi:hypothetical protein